MGSSPYADYAAGVEQAAAEAEYTVLLGTTGFDPRKDESCLRIFRERQVDGVIITTATMDSAPVLARYAAETPLLLLARGIPTAPYDFVGSDTRAGATRLLEYVTLLGHSRIGMISGTVKSQILTDRLEGYRHGLRSAGVESDDRLIVRCDYSIENGRAAALSLMKLDPPPTAILGAHEFLTFGAFDALCSASISVPTAVSVASFVDHPMMSLSTVGLTSLTRPRRQMGAAAFSLLLRRIEGLNPPTPQSVIFAEELVIRTSTGPRGREVPSTPLRNLDQSTG